MNAFKMWVATHPTQPGNCKTSFTEPKKSEIYIESGYHSQEGEYADWQEFVCIPVSVGP